MVWNSVATVRRVWVGAVVPGCLLVGCGSTSAGAPTSTGFAATSTTSLPTATELAESQISASTVTAPAIPGPCDPGEIEVQAVEAGADVDQVIGLVNRGDLRCEVDVGGSPEASLDLEPNVVLGPGDGAYLWISEISGCEGSTADSPKELELRINGASQVVPLTFAARCGVELWAFFTD